MSFPSYPGSVCDVVGPRYGAAFLLLTIVPCVVATAAISTPLGFIIVRLFIGFVLATFVTTQVRHVTNFGIVKWDRYSWKFGLALTAVSESESVSSDIHSVFVFVVQYWMSSMFTSKIVGMANGLAAGWGNMGGGFIQLIMPALQALFENSYFQAPVFTAWRIAFFIPALMQICAGMLILAFGQDSPDGQYLALAKKGVRKLDSFPKV